VGDVQGGASQRSDSSRAAAFHSLRQARSPALAAASQ
jgi:hypothetical protein